MNQQARSGWQRVSRIGAANHGCLDPDDVCYYYQTREHHAIGDAGLHGYSKTYRTIQDFKLAPSECARRADYARYKERATRQIAEDLARLLSRPRREGATFALVPAVTSKARTDPDYDDRLIDVCRRVANGLPHVECFDALSVDISTPKSRIGKRPDIGDLLAHIIVTPGLPLASFDYVFVFDDVLTRGAHFKACQTALVRAYGIRKPGGLFWARSESPLDRIQGIR